eukprot:349707-Chlamydomonas_euryale.AAC.5
MAVFHDQGTRQTMTLGPKNTNQAPACDRLPRAAGCRVQQAAFSCNRLLHASRHSGRLPGSLRKRISARISAATRAPTPRPPPARPHLGRHPHAHTLASLAAQSFSRLSASCSRSSSSCHVQAARTQTAPRQQAGPSVRPSAGQGLMGAHVWWEHMPCRSAPDSC